MEKKIKINLAKNAGFCGGVFRAFEMVKREFNGGSKKRKERVLILGSLVHNENVMKEVKLWGIKKISTLRGVAKGERVIITAHGIGEDVLGKIRHKGAVIFDATCPKVSLIHNEVKEHLKEGYKVVIFGDKGHKEVKGINGWCKGRAKILNSISDAKKYIGSVSFKRNRKPFFVVSQTTQNVEEFHEVTALLADEAKKIKVFVKAVDTICRATINRQEEAREIAKSSQGVIVVGGEKSANTKRLFKIAKLINSNTIIVKGLDAAGKVKIKRLAKKCQNIGVLSGASTPLYDIEKIVEFINQR